MHKNKFLLLDFQLLHDSNDLKHLTNSRKCSKSNYSDIKKNSLGIIKCQQN